LRLSVIAALAGACLLSACGRKGPLDPPPGGMVLQQRPGLTPTTNRAGQQLPEEQQLEYDEQGRPIAPTGPKRRTPLDWLID
jgi:YD repeat-containing protein